MMKEYHIIRCLLVVVGGGKNKIPWRGIDGEKEAKGMPTS